MLTRPRAWLLGIVALSIPFAVALPRFAIEGEAIDLAAAADPTVARVPDGTWLLALPQGSSVLLARSPDGRHFRPEGPPVPLEGIPELWVCGPTVHLRGGASRLRQLVSDDSGRSWRDGPPLTVELPPEVGLGSPSVSGAPGQWRLFAIKLAPGGGLGCQPSETSLCLGRGRFRATVSWDDGRGGHGPGHARTKVGVWMSPPNALG